MEERVATDDVRNHEGEEVKIIVFFASTFSKIRVVILQL